MTGYRHIIQRLATETRYITRHGPVLRVMLLRRGRYLYSGLTGRRVDFALLRAWVSDPAGLWNFA